MKNFIRQPLFHFFALGAALFVLFAFLNDDSGSAPGEIVVDANRVAALATQFERTWQRPPTPQEMQGLIDSWIREDILYREGLAMGLDRDDPIVRRRVAQKIEFMADGGVRPPDDTELGDWLEAHPDSYRVPPKYAFEQRLFSPERHGDELPITLQNALAALKSGDTAFAGDTTLLPGSLELTSAPQIARTFGDEFVAALDDQPPGEWAGPVRSGYGLHLVRIEQKEPGYLPSLEEVRPALERDLMQAQSEEAKLAFYEALRARYDVRIVADPQMAGERTPE